MRVFLDANVLVFAAERPGSNSDAIYRLARAGRLEVVVDEVVLQEVRGYFRRRASRSFAWQYAEQVRRIAGVVTTVECREHLAAIGGRLKPADRLHLAACRHAGAAFLVAVDADFEGYPEYRTPEQLTRTLGLRASSTQW